MRRLLRWMRDEMIMCMFEGSMCENTKNCASLSENLKVSKPTMMRV
jgi:hypothetical protein